ncbi:MAG: tetratricopeptide repeat protein [Candidatus Schekmanbacteria bacterium]|nr:tetratricopeptide repeat protein [Candidatus Schekmanbacteria bacterium]
MDFQPILDQGKAFLRSGEYDKAERLFASVLDREPAHAEAVTLLNQAQTLRMLGEGGAGEASSPAREAADSAPDRRQVDRDVLLGVEAYTAGELGEALVKWLRALSKVPDHEKARRYVDQAVARYKKRVAKGYRDGDKDAQRFFQKAAAFSEAGNVLEAAVALEVAQFLAVDTKLRADIAELTGRLARGSGKAANFPDLSGILSSPESAQPFLSLTDSEDVRRRLEQSVEAIAGGLSIEPRGGKPSRAPTFGGGFSLELEEAPETAGPPPPPTGSIPLSAGNIRMNRDASDGLLVLEEPASVPELSATPTARLTLDTSPASTARGLELELPADDHSALGSAALALDEVADGPAEAMERELSLGGEDSSSRFASYGMESSSGALLFEEAPAAQAMPETPREERSADLTSLLKHPGGRLRNQAQEEREDLPKLAFGAPAPVVAAASIGTQLAATGEEESEPLKPKRRISPALIAGIGAGSVAAAALVAWGIGLFDSEPARVPTAERLTPPAAASTPGPPSDSAGTGTPAAESAGAEQTAAAQAGGTPGARGSGSGQEHVEDLSAELLATLSSFERGLAFFDQKRYDDALRELRKIQASEPDYERAQRGIKQVEEAKADLVRRQDRVEKLLTIAAAQRKRGDLARAELTYRDILRIDAGSADGRKGLDDVLAERTRGEKILEATERGKTFYRLKKYAAAREAFKEVLEVDPFNTDARFYLGKMDQQEKAGS